METGNVPEVPPDVVPLCNPLTYYPDPLYELSKEAISSDARRDELIDQLEDLLDTPLADAIKTFTGQDYWDTPATKTAVNSLPKPLQRDLIEGAIGALRNGLLLHVALAYSDDGSVGADITSWYTVPPGKNATRVLRLICPDLHPS